MKKRYGFGLLALGLVGLGWWAQGHQAVRIERLVAEQAAAVVQGSVHGASLDVSGRDIALLGTIDGPDEMQRIVTALEALPGRRVVTADQAVVLPVVEPFTLDVIKSEGGAFAASGHVNTENTRAALAASLGATAAGLKLAAGAPEGWVARAEAGLAALGPMQSGRMVLNGTKLEVTGTVLGPDQAAAVDAALEGIPGEDLTRDLEILDDGSPAAYEVNFTAASGAFVSGKLPNGLDAAAIQQAMGLSSIATDVTQGFLGEPQTAAGFAPFKDWLGRIESLTVMAGPDLRRVAVGVLPGVDADAVKAGLAGVLGGGAEVTVAAVQPEGQNGQTRVHAGSGEAQRFMGGFWVAVPQISLDLAGCQAAADGLLAAETITFLSGSDELDASAVSVINRLAGIMARCAEEAGLKAVIAGHTDNVGDPAGNLGLSQRRAIAVRKALIDRGVPGAAMVGIGYGDTQPVADNATDEGRAKNRRTAIVWSE